MNSHRIIQGIGASPGIGIGAAWVWPDVQQVPALGSDPQPGRVRRPDVQQGLGPEASDPDEAVIADGRWTLQWERFVAARSEVIVQLDDLKEKMRSEGHDNEAALFDAHVLLLEDPGLVNPIREQLRTGGSAEKAVRLVTEQVAGTFEEMSDPYFRERVADIRDVGMQLVRELHARTASLRPSGDLSSAATDGPSGDSSSAAPLRPSGVSSGGPVVVIAYDVTPSDTAHVDLKLTAALVMEGGGPLSHAAILARARGIPAVVAAVGVRDAVETGQTVIVDGNDGRVVISPDERTAEKYRLRVEAQRREPERASDPEDAVIADGQRVAVMSNIGNAEEADRAFAVGADGIGLFRTEFLWMDRTVPPDEEEQLAEYQRAVEAMAGKPVVFRTLDIGGDKPTPALNLELEDNPALGWRGIRLCLGQPDIFRTQLRAMLQATQDELFIMFSMVTDPGEVRAVRPLLDQAREELGTEGRPTPRTVRVGIMVETAATALAAAQCAPLVDFFSLGTNDLTQYSLGVDRGNPKVASLYEPYHPGVLRIMAEFMEATHDHGCRVGVCGEMGAIRLRFRFSSAWACRN